MSGHGIVHIGTGAFHRAHQAVYTEAAMRTHGGDWKITGVSLRSTQVADALNAQGGRYTLVTRGQSGTEYQRVEAISGVLAAARGLDPILAALSRPQTRIVSLTITEKGYAAPYGPDSAITLLVAALKARRQAGLGAVTLLSCDNLSDNGAVLRAAVLAAAEADPPLSRWIEAEVRFPSCMVDRITPATTPALVREVERETGWADAVPVETEAFSQWVIEDDFACGRPAWDAAGVQMVHDVAPFEQMKLRMLNGAHSMLAFAGHLAGKRHVRDVMEDAVLAPLVARHMNAAAGTLTAQEGLDPDRYRTALLERFRNPHLAHETYQIAMDGSQKMPQRIFAPALEAAQKGADLRTFAFATAVWAQYLRGRTDAGQSYALRDPREAELATLPEAPEARVAALFALPDLVPPALAAKAEFREQVTAMLVQLSEDGVIRTVRQSLRG